VVAAGGIEKDDGFGDGAAFARQNPFGLSLSKPCASLPT